MTFAILATFFFAFSALAVSNAARMLGSSRANLIRLTIACVAFAIYTRGAGFDSPGLRYFILSGFIGMGIGDLAFLHALPVLGARISMLYLMCLSFPLAAMFEWIVLGKTVTVIQLGLCLIIFIGLYLALGKSPNVPDNIVPEKKRNLFGFFLVFIAAAAQAIGAVMSRMGYRISESGGMPMDGAVAASLRIIGGIGVAVVFYLLSGRREKISDSKGFLWLFATALLGPIIGLSFFQQALITETSALVLTVTSFAPLIVMLVTFLTKEETPGLRVIAGSVISVGGLVALIQTRL